MGFLCVTQSHTIDCTAVARNGGMDKFWKWWSGLKCILLAWKPLLKVKFCAIIAWEIPSDVKKIFCYCWVGFNCEYGRCSNINQQFVFTRLSKIVQIALTFWLQEKIVCILNMKEICFEFLYDIRGNSSVLVTFFLLWRASHDDHVTHFLSSNTLIYIPLKVRSLRSPKILLQFLKEETLFLTVVIVSVYGAM